VEWLKWKSACLASVRLCVQTPALGGCGEDIKYLQVPFQWTPLHISAKQVNIHQYTIHDKILGTQKNKARFLSAEGLYSATEDISRMDMYRAKYLNTSKRYKGL
jgi:hypothetical protein